MMDPETFADLVVTTIKRALEGPKATITELEARVTHLEARPLQKWAGTHIAGVRYAEASLVTKGGSLWVATSATTTAPGDPGGDWRLIVKRGAHDAR